MRFYVYLPESLQIATTNVSFTISGKNGNSYASTVPYSTDLKTNSKGYIGFTYYVNTIQMADTITATMHYTENGEAKTLEKTYTVKEYFETFDAAYEANPEDYTEEVVNLIKATADLGHYLQPYVKDREGYGWSFGEGTDQHVEMDHYYAKTYSADDLSSTTSAVASHALSVETSGSVTNDIRKLGYTIDFESTMALRVTVTVKSDYTGTVTANWTSEKGDSGECTVSQPSTNDTSVYLVEVPNIMAHQLSDKYTITITTENGTITLTASALSYAQMMLASANGNTTTQNAMIAFYRYSKFADIVKGTPADVEKTDGRSNY